LFEEDTGHLLVEVELPGVPREDIGLELDEDDEDGSMSLTIAALKPQRAKEESGMTHMTRSTTHDTHDTRHDTRHVTRC
jgi:HSP20 family molecular chaperone IbpA